MFGKKIMIKLPSIEASKAYVNQDVIHFAAIHWDDRCEVIGVCALDYLRISSWPRARTVASQCHAVVNLPWKWCRNQSLDFIWHNSRCSSCGWLTGQLALDDELCKECFNVGVCRSCHYLDASGKYRCVQCLPMFSKYENHISMESFLHRFQLFEKINEFRRSGDYNMLLGSIDLKLMRLIVKEWRLLSAFSA